MAMRRRSAAAATSGWADAALPAGIIEQPEKATAAAAATAMRKIFLMDMVRCLRVLFFLEALRCSGARLTAGRARR
jgi:hypothetical protein